MPFGRWALLLGLACGPAAAQPHHGHDHGSAALGTVNFPVTCSAEAQAAFNAGMKLQHSFWYQAAGETFQEVRQRDPGCTMAYWGEALSLLTNPFSPPTLPNLRRARALLDEASRIGARSEREAGYISALAEVFAAEDLAGHRARLMNYRAAMERLQQRFPDDSELAIQFALVLGVTASPADKSHADQLRGAAILEREWLRQPDHPGVVHYLIHLYDVPALADRGIPAAERYAVLAADAAHALHMPSHIFTRVGRWDASIETNRRSAARAIATNDPEGEFHALDYMVYAYLQTGRDAAAREALAGAGRAEGPVRNAKPFAAAAMPARIALERGAWDEAAALVPVETPFPQTAAMTHFARALGHARSGRPAAASGDIDALRRLAERLRGTDAYWAEQLDIQRIAAEGWVAFASGRREDGLRLLREATDRESRTDKAAITPGPLAPARELLAEALLEAGDARAALAEFEAVSRTEPRRFRATAGAMQAAAAAGDTAAARRHAAALVDIAPNPDSPRPAIERARVLLAQR